MKYSVQKASNNPHEGPSYNGPLMDKELYKPYYNKLEADIVCRQLNSKSNRKFMVVEIPEKTGISKQLEDIRRARIEEIKSLDIPNLEKLKLFDKEKLFRIGEFIEDADIFHDWMIETDKHCASFISPARWDKEKYSIFYFHEIEQFFEDGEECIVAVYGSGKERVYKLVDEIIDKVYQYAIDNEICGYEFKW